MYLVFSLGGISPNAASLLSELHRQSTWCSVTPSTIVTNVDPKVKSKAEGDLKSILN